MSARDVGLAAGALVALVVVSAAAAPAAAAPSTVARETLARIVAVGVPLGVGLYACRLPPFVRFGRLLLVTAIGVLLATLSLSGSPLLYSVGRAVTWLLEAWLLYLMLSFPFGRLPGRADRMLVTAGALLVGVLYLPTVLMVEHFPAPATWAACATCPHNAFMLLSSEPAVVGDVIVPLREALTIGVFLAVTARLAQRISGATRLRRKTLTPVLAVAAARCLVLGVALGARRAWPASPVVDAAMWLLAFAVPAMALAFLLGLLRWWLYVGSSLRRLTAGLRSSIGPESLRRALAEAFEDPTLSIAYRLTDGGWVDAEGRPERLPAPHSGRCVTEVLDGERVVAVLLHDAALQDERAFADAAGAYAVLAFENQRLAASLSALRREADASRSRISVMVDRERKRIERDLHDGAQQRLVALSIKLEHASDLVGRDPAGGRRMLHELSDQVELALYEVRALGRGAAPPELERAGLVTALKAAVRGAPAPAAVITGPLGRYPAQIESAVYFCCLEAVQNASRHATGASAVRVVLSERDEELAFEVRDDGPGFDPATVGGGSSGDGGAGLGNMRLRMAALGGALEIESAPGRGTRVSGAVPLYATA